MNNRDIFIQEYPAHSSRTVQLADGGTAYPYSALAVGRIDGLYRSLPALMSPDATDKDNWYVVNIDDDTTNGHLKAVAVLGATSEDQAKSWAIKTIGVHLNASPRAWHIAISSAKALKNFLDRSASRGSFAISQTMLDTIAKQITDTPIAWVNESSCELKSHNGNASELLHEMVRQDDDAQLVDSMNSADLACLLAELGAEEEDYNAIIVQYAKLDDFINRMNQAMAKAAVNKLSIANFTKTKPFKRNNVVNIALLWDLSDGQSMTIVFHNPDSTPSKLQAGDVLTSWKFMLNKRDITAAVSPEQGKNAQPIVIAKRMMLIAEKNSARFVRTNAKKDEKVKALSDLELANENTQNEIARILAQNEALQNEIDAVVAQNAKTQVEQKTKPKKATVAEAKDAYDTLDFSVTDLLGHRADEFKAADVVGRLQPKIDAIQVLLDRGVRSDWAERLLALVKKAQGLIVSWQAPNPPQPTETETELEVNDLPALGVANIISIGNENIYIQKDGKSYFSKVGNTQGYSVGEWDFAKYPDGVIKQESTVEPEVAQNANEPPMTNPDRDYLQSIIEGKTDLSNADDIEAKLTEISERLDTELEPLFEQAAEAFAQYAIAQAATV